MNIAEAAAQTNALLLQPFTWTKGSFATNANDERVSVGSVAACKFCMVGAMRFVTGQIYSHLEQVVRDHIYAETKNGVYFFNDRTANSVKDVVKMINKAVQGHEQEEAN